MALLSVIRRWHHREGMPIREIVRRTGLSRNTVRKYLVSGVVEPKYPKRKSERKLDEYTASLNNWLHREYRRSRKQRRSVKQLYFDLVELGYTGSYDRVAAFARDWRQEQQEARNRASRGNYVPLSFTPGEAFQFDWSEDYAVIAGQNTTLQIEKNVRDSRHRIWQRAPTFQTLNDFNDWLEQRCLVLWTDSQHPEDKSRTIAEVWQEERDQLRSKTHVR